MKKIVIIEDNDDILFALKTQLESWGYTVFSVKEGREGILLVRKVKPHLIILDIMLPGLDGIRIASLIKHDVYLSKIPVIILTARSDKKTMDLSNSLGVEKYLNKPVDPLELKSAIEELVNKSVR